MCAHLSFVGFTRVHTFVTWDSHELTHNLTGLHAQTAIPTQVDLLNSTVITCVHTYHLWDSHVFTLFVCGMQRIHKHKKVGCALNESLCPTCPAQEPPRTLPKRSPQSRRRGPISSGWISHATPRPRQPPSAALKGACSSTNGTSTHNFHFLQRGNPPPPSTAVVLPLRNTEKG